MNLVDSPTNSLRSAGDAGGFLGMPDATRHNIFRSFAQADSSITRKHDGIGLGLDISLLSRRCSRAAAARSVSY